MGSTPEGLWEAEEHKRMEARLTVIDEFRNLHPKDIYSTERPNVIYLETFSSFNQTCNMVTFNEGTKRSKTYQERVIVAVERSLQIITDLYEWTGVWLDNDT